jgi:hypothetical protein
VTLSAAQRDWLRVIRDQLTRERLAIPGASTPKCSGCGCWMHQFNADCLRCRKRHKARRQTLRRAFAEGRLPSEQNVRARSLSLASRLTPIAAMAAILREGIG